MKVMMKPKAIASVDDESDSLPSSSTRTSLMSTDTRLSASRRSMSSTLYFFMRCSRTTSATVELTASLTSMVDDSRE